MRFRCLYAFCILYGPIAVSAGPRGNAVVYGAIPSSQVTLESTGGRRLLHTDEYIRQRARLFKTADSLSTS